MSPNIAKFCQAIANHVTVAALSMVLQCKLMYCWRFWNRDWHCIVG